MNHQNKLMSTIASLLRDSLKVFKTSFFVFLAAAFLMSGFFVSTAHALTTLTVTSPNNGTEEWRGIQNITWSTTGGVSGDLVNIVYSTDNFASQAVIATGVAYDAQPYSWNTAAFPESTNYKVRFIDASLFVYDTSDTAFIIDNTDPVTTYTIAPVSPDGINGWYVTVPTITLSCNDGAGSGCNNTYYKWDAAASWTTYTVPFSALEGEHTLSFYSDDQATDALGARNIETVQTQTIKVDTTFPTVAVTSATMDGYYNAGDTINVTLTFSEAVSSTNTLTANLNSGGSCVVPTLTNTTTGNCTYIVLGGQNSSDLTVTSIVPASGVVEDIAGNDSTLFPTSNIADTSAIVVDTTAPSAFTVGTVTITGGTVVSGWWNSTNATTTIEVPFANDPSLIAGVMQLQAEADGTFENIGSANEIFESYLGYSVAFSIPASQIEALAGFSEGDVVTFRAIITDRSGNATTGTPSATTLTVDQTLPTVDAGTDKEVSTATPQDATTTDPAPASGIATWAWTANSGNVNFTSASTEDTDISATVDGTYAVTLTVTDTAGNSNSDTMTFVWDTIDPLLTAVTLVPTPTNDTSPSYTFNVDKAAWLVGNTGTINITGSCGVWTPSVAVDGNNTVTFTGPLSDAMYTDCDITVTDAAGNTPGILAINDFEVDTIAAMIASVTTEDLDENGSIDTATLVFTDEIDDSTIILTDFAIGGINPTLMTTGTDDDATIVFTFGTQIAGTEAKTLNYTSSADDLAGNNIAPFSEISVDEAGPVLLSAITTSTTTIDALFSENLNGATINDSGTEFTVVGFAVSDADDGSDDTVTLTVATMPTDATPNVTFTNTGTFKDLNGNEAVTPVTVTAVDGVAPVLTVVSISSNNAKDGTAWAKEGDTVTVAFTSSEELDTAPELVVTIDGNPADSITNVIGNDWEATRVMQAGDTESSITFTIDFEDVAVPTHNLGTQVTTVTDMTDIIYDETAPSVDAGMTPKYINIAVSSINQDGTITDGGSGVDLTETLWTQTAGPGTATPTPNNAEDTVLTANTDGTYTMQLFGEDNAGNSATDTMTLVRDTISPFVKTYSPTTGKVNVPVTAGTATVTFNETISTLDASGATIFKDSDESSVANGTASVSGGNDATAILELPYVMLDTGTIYRFNVNPNAIRDTAGNPFILSFANHFYTVADETAPVIDLPVVTDITATGATLSVTTNEDATCRYSDADEAYGTMVAMTTTGGTLHSVAITGLTADTSYNYYVRCADTSPAVNVTSSTHLPFKTSNVPDITVPTPVINTTSATVNSNTYTISGTIGADTPTDGIRTISIYNGGSSAGSASVPFGQTAWSVVVSLTQNATSTFSATASDVAGNVSDVSNTVDIGDDDSLDEDNSAPVAPEIDTALDNIVVDADTYEIIGISINDGVRTIVVEKGGSPVGTVVLPAGETAWAVTVSLTQNATSTFTAYTYDEAGNKSAVSNSVEIADATPTTDVTAPFISNIRTSGIATTSVTIEWETDEISTSVVEYGSGTELSYGTTVTGTGGVTAHSVTLTGLTENTTYHFRVTSADTATVPNTSTSLGNLVQTAMDDTATLAVTGIDAVKTYASNTDLFPDGWSWTFYITVPTVEVEFAMKFDNFVSGSNTIFAADNIRYYTAQSSTASTTASSVTILGANAYPGNITLDSDLDAGTAGRQIVVTVEMKVPVGSAGGSYSASYGINSDEIAD